ncbi:MAG: hypothetical protein ACLQVY_18765 [Limisphaerales bacterium]
MSDEKVEKRGGRGGARKNAGRPKGSGTKTKICLSVDQDNWYAAVKRWKQKPSWLVDGLISYYVKSDGGGLKQEAA